MRVPLRILALVALSSLLGASLARALVIKEYHVPSVTPTIQAAVALADVDGSDLSIIDLDASPITTFGEVLIGNAYKSGHRLLVRPDPTIATLPRVRVVSIDPGSSVFHLNGAGYVTVEDLDIFRDITNAHHLVEIETGTQVLFQRCRIGSIYATPSGTSGWANVWIQFYPVHVMLRNCVMFSRVAGTFDEGIHVDGFQDLGNSVLLYNNDVSDYGREGIHVIDIQHDSYVVMRNNVVANVFATTDPEPLAYHSGVINTAFVYSSGNAAFATAARVQTVDAACLDVAGADVDLLSPGVLGNTADPSTAFQQVQWNAVPPGDANPLFFHLWPSGALHDGLEDVGTTVGAGSPAIVDDAVTDDIDHTVRPGGAAPGHTDRGAHQVDAPGVGVTAASLTGRALRAAPRRNPTADFALDYVAERTGTLTVDVFDASGRRLFHDQRDVVRPSRGSVRAPGRLPSGLAFYRVVLDDAAGRRHVASGRVAVIR
ncbi:MAG TPA: right-handed parallel beta-helix repeat-containing protein [Candidatus Saccharimonadaceae bacterium]|nr:right-handed parallel beta-helix repeat-containing protein [Candidatus Saccharimonadaceae bacterium]